jgi:MYXO-CTERM domain-containing protein
MVELTMKTSSNKLSNSVSSSAPSSASSRRVRSKVVTSLAALCAAAGPFVGHTDARAQNYAGVNNALPGVTSLLRDDDLVVSLGNQYDSPPLPGANNSMISSIATSRSNGTQRYAVTCKYPPCVPGNYLAWDNERIPVVGRFFNEQRDEVVEAPVFFTPSPTPGSNDYRFKTLDPRTDATTPNPINFYGAADQALPYGNSKTMVMRPAVADFNGDGLDDVLMVYADWGPQFAGNSRARIASAANPDDPTAGFTFGPESNLGFVYGVRSVAAGDFDGDGKPDFAVTYVDNDKKVQLAIYSVDANLVATQRSVTTVETLTDFSVDPQVELVAGRFTNQDKTQIVVANRSGPKAGEVKLRVFDVQSNFTTQARGELTVPGAVNRVKMLTGKFNWSAATDSLALMLTNVNDGNSTSAVSVLSVNPTTLALSTSGTLNVASDIYGTSNKNYVALDIAVGNFDNRMSVPQGAATDRDPNLQLAIAVGYCQGTNLGQKQFDVKDVNVYDVIDPATGNLSLKKMSAIPMNTGVKSQKVTNMTIRAADLQGRSMRLGNGFKVSVSRMSPSMILAQPPMHVDYALPTSGSSEPALVNLSLAPDKFNAAYSTTSSKSTEERRSETKGWNFSSKVSVGATVTLGTSNLAGGLDNGVSLSEVYTAEQDTNQSTDKRYGTTTDSSQTIATTTGSNDGVWFDNAVTYVYGYEVIGRTVCPDGQATCADADKVPMTVMFSAPGGVKKDYLSGEALSFYQPVWENGNLLSYPGNEAQLRAGLPDANILNDDSKFFRTDSASTSVSTTWAQSTSVGEDVSYSRVLQETSDTTVEAAVSAKWISASASLNLNFSKSDSFASLETSQTTIANSSGLTMSKDLTFQPPAQYGYRFSPVVYGQTTPPDYFNGADPKTPNTGLPPVTSKLNVFGPMRSAFLADPLSDGGTWWRQTYGGKPDIALNHPDRWSFSKDANTSPAPSRCVATRDGHMDCATVTPRTPDDPFGDSFHHMRGFFVYRKGDANPADPTHQGMQQTLATAGDPLTLEARVYNYSLAAMDPRAKVHVAFYAMPWDEANGKPMTAPDGGAATSVRIGEYVGGPIQPFNTSTSIPNYVLAYVDFDTTAYANQDLVFWVVAWGENADGTMMQELPNKGLTSSPAAVGGAQAFTNVAALEPTLANAWKSYQTDPDTTSFSNNVGLYRQVFHVKARPSALATANETDVSPAGLQELSIAQVDVAPSSVLALGQPSDIRVELSDSGQSMEGASAYFYDGDPEQDGKLFAMERLAYIPAGGEDQVRARFKPATCGEHDIYVEVAQEGLVTGAAKAATITVDCDAPAPPPEDGGGCSVGQDPKTGWGWLAPLVAIAAGFGLRRKRVPATR